MNQALLRESIDMVSKPGDCFIKWWRSDEALVDYELLDRFVNNLPSASDIAGFELLDLEGMWQVLQTLDPDPLDRVMEEKEVIKWKWLDRQGKEHITIFPFTPEGVMELMESEFFD